MGSNELIKITLIYTKQIIHLSGPVDETSFFARNRPILLLGQKGILTTPFLYKQSIFDPRPENCLSFSKKSPQKIV